MQKNKSQVIEDLAGRLGITVIESERNLKTLINYIYENLHNGNDINISGFGKFTVSHREPRIGVNPRNPSIKIQIPELNTVKFKAGEAFKEAIKLRKE